MPRVMACNGSYMLEKAFPDTSGDAAQEGTAAHTLAAWDLNGKGPASQYAGMEVDGVPVTEEMAEHVGTYVEYCRDVTAGSSQVLIEQQQGMTHDSIELNGTPDYIVYNDKVIHVIDLKYGFGWVEPIENWQLITYAVLVWLSFGGVWMPKTVRLTIVQPRANHPGGPVRHWEFDGHLLRNYYNNICNGIECAAQIGAETRSGKHCRYCKAILDCQTNRQTSGQCLDVIDKARMMPTDAPGVAVEMSRIETAIERLTHRLTALEAHGIALVQGGQPVPGYECKQSYGRAGWTVDVIAAGDEMGVDLRAPEKPVTPAQAVSRKLMPERMVKMISARKPGGFKLKRVDMDAIRRIIVND